MNNLDILSLDTLQNLIKTNPEYLDAIAEEIHKRSELSFEIIEEQIRFTKHKIRFIEKREKGVGMAVIHRVPKGK